MAVNHCNRPDYCEPFAFRRPYQDHGRSAIPLETIKREADEARMNYVVALAAPDLRPHSLDRHVLRLGE